MRYLVIIFILTGLYATPVFADQWRFVNPQRKQKEQWHMVESVEILSQKPDRPYIDLGKLEEVDAFTSKDEQLITWMRYKAAQVKANALIDVSCDTKKYFRTKVCSAHAIRWEKTP